MRPTVGTVLSFTPDTRWTTGRLRVRRDANRTDLPEPDEPEYELPFLGWSVVVRFVSADGEYETDLSPTFLAEEAYASTMHDINQQAMDGYSVLLEALR